MTSLIGKIASYKRVCEPTKVVGGLRILIISLITISLKYGNQWDWGRHFASFYVEKVGHFSSLPVIPLIVMQLLGQPMAKRHRVMVDPIYDWIGLADENINSNLCPLQTGEFN